MSSTDGVCCALPMFFIILVVDGNYTEWSNWTSCSKACGPGEQVRRRNCTKPRPAHGGADCHGPATEIRECFIEVICSGKEVLCMDYMSSRFESQNCSISQ